MKTKPTVFEAPTLALLGLTYLAWGLATTALVGVSLWVAVPVLSLATALHASLQHEVIHGHPTPFRWVNEALVFPALGLLIPYLRFRETHLAHHTDANLTDPYDDPESNYLDPAVWTACSVPRKTILRINSTLAGRLLLGPLVGQAAFMADDWRQIRGGNRPVLIGWLAHIPAVGVVIAWLIWVGQMPLWAIVLGTYCAQAILKIRTFLEHQAHESARGRTVIIEDRGWLSFLFLNNNLHVVHHMHPRVPWYRLRALYFGNKARYQACNRGYVFGSYAQVFRRYFLRAKDPVPHPLWPGDRS